MLTKRKNIYFCNRIQLTIVNEFFCKCYVFKELTIVNEFFCKCYVFKGSSKQCNGYQISWNTTEFIMATDGDIATCTFPAGIFPSLTICTRGCSSSFSSASWRHRPETQIILIDDMLPLLKDSLTIKWFKAASCVSDLCLKVLNEFKQLWRFLFQQLHFFLPRHLFQVFDNPLLFVYTLAFFLLLNSKFLQLKKKQKTSTSSHM